MALPPLQPVPHLRRLLVPGEEILYTAKFHPLRGWWLLFPGMALVVASHWVVPLLAFGLLTLWVWALPFKTNEVAVTNKRLLVRLGWWHLKLEAIDRSQIEAWALDHNVVASWLHCGDVSIGLKDGTDVRVLELPWLWHPMTFLEALETLQEDADDRPGKRNPQQK